MWFSNRSDTNRPVQAQKRNCTIRVAKTKALISFAVTSKLICAFVFAYTNCWFSHEAAQIVIIQKILNILQSTLEFKLRQQEFIEMIRENRRIEAVR